MTDDQVPLWERQPWDTTASYKAFKTYYLPASANPFPLITAYRKYRLDKGATQAPRNTSGAWVSWSRGLTANGKPLDGSRPWKARADAWNAHLDQEELRALAAQRLASRKLRIRTLEMAHGQAGIAASRLQFDPRQDDSMDLPAFKDLVRGLVQLNSELRKEFGDEPSQRLIIESPDGRPLIEHKTTIEALNYDFSGLTDDDLRDRIERLNALRAADASGADGGGGEEGTADGQIPAEGGGNGPPADA